MIEIALEKNIIAGIPILTLVPVEARSLPLIFFIPGYGGTKEAGLSIGFELAKKGFYFLSFDPMFHGERYNRRVDHAWDPALGGIYPPETGLDTGVIFFQVIAQCLEDSRLLLKHIDKDPRADITRCGVTGLSMGGYASFLLFSDLPQIRAAVPMIGLPSFARRWRDLLDECAYTNPEWAAALEKVRVQTQEYTHFIEQIDPMSKLKDAAPKALLIMNCDFDSDQPKLYSIDGYRELLPHYQSEPDKLVLRIYPAAHEVTPAMMKDTVEWFSQHLKRND